jgi:hypothetical protein
MAKTFICSDESVNAYGFRVLTDGIQLTNFKKNPVGFFNHETGGWWSNRNDYSGPVIRWENIKKEDGKLMADAVFDVSDKLGKQLQNKVENDFIRAASIGFRIISTSNDPTLMLQGQTGPTVTKCELIEISVVDIPANKNAIALYDADGKKIEINDSNVSMALKAGLPHEKLKEDNKMKVKIAAAWTALAAFLGLTTGQEHEVEITSEKLQELDQLASRLQAAADTTIADLTRKLAEAQIKIDGLTAEVSALKKPATPVTHPVKEGNDPATADTEDEEELTDTDREARAFVKKFNIKPAKQTA